MPNQNKNLNIYFGEGHFLGNLKIYPIYGDTPQPPFEYYTIEEAQKEGIINFKETGNINAIEIDYAGGKPVVIVEGDEVIGARQNRIFTSEVLLKERQTNVFPANCVEQNRWSGGEFFTPGEFTAFPSIRKTLIESILFINSTKREKRKGTYLDFTKSWLTENSKSQKSENSFFTLLAAARHTQNTIWEKISHKLDTFKITSATLSMHDTYERKKSLIQQYLSETKFDDKTIGFAIFIKDKLLGVEIFPNNRLFNKFKNKLLKSYLIEGLSMASISKLNFKKEKSNLKVEKLVSAINEAFKERVKEIQSGDGMLKISEKDNLYVKSLNYNDCPLHITLFSKDFPE